MKHIRYSILRQMYRNRELLKAVSLALYVKSRITSSSISRCTVNKLHELTGLSAATVKKRLKTLLAYELVEWQGKKQDCLVFRNLSSKCKHRNFCVEGINIESVKEIEQSLRVMLIVCIQRQKDFAKRAIQASRDGKSVAEVKKGRRICECYCYLGEYLERGLSYKGIAKRLGVSIATAFKAVQYAVRHKFLIKTRHFEQFFVEKVGQFSRKIGHFLQNTFSTQNNIYTVSANTYAIHPRILHGNN